MTLLDKYAQQVNIFVDVCHRLSRNMYVASHGGNLAWRLEDDLILITPTQVNKGDITPPDLVFIRPSGAVVEGIALRYAFVLEELESVLGSKIERVHIVGGGIKNELLCQWAADAMDRPVLAGPVEATALGNLAVQAIAAGRLNDLAAARRLIGRSVPVKTYAPRDRAGWRRRRERYSDLYR